MEGLTPAELRAELARGGKFVVFPYCISIVVITFRRSSDVVFVRAGEGALGHALPYLALSLFFGWWGFPWGIIHTPVAIIECLGGGKDVTSQIAPQLGA